MCICSAWFGSLMLLLLLCFGSLDVDWFSVRPMHLHPRDDTHHTRIRIQISIIHISTRPHAYLLTHYIRNTHYASRITYEDVHSPCLHRSSAAVVVDGAQCNPPSLACGYRWAVGCVWSSGSVQTLGSSQLARRRRVLVRD
ncbi:hypothetical protein C8Q80DRAFT_595601 [Daedaleopsis nitida]|nr:hypothetical protein C8Q80DRAFT_595601 [Daedaleopsis nitida]